MNDDICLNCAGTKKKIILTISLNVRDPSSNLWIDLFGNVAESFLGIKGEEY